ncbi:MAG: hypothetical protein J7L39_03190, partial [Candidatus Aenigmarchaeota archaeon]|nr:hypothetical protein [Candidatus Aenigmarchaeota archaeon]
MNMKEFEREIFEISQNSALDRRIKGLHFLKASPLRAELRGKLLNRGILSLEISDVKDEELEILKEISQEFNGSLEIADAKSSLRIYLNPRSKDASVYLWREDRLPLGIEWYRGLQIANKIMKYDEELGLAVLERLGELRDESCIYNLLDEIDEWRVRKIEKGKAIPWDSDLENLILTYFGESGIKFLKEKAILTYFRGREYLVIMNDKDLKRFSKELATQIKFVYRKSKEIRNEELFKDFCEEMKAIYPKLFDEAKKMLGEEIREKVEKVERENGGKKKKLFYALLGIAIPAVIGGVIYYLQNNNQFKLDSDKDGIPDDVE